MSKQTNNVTTNPKQKSPKGCFFYVFFGLIAALVFVGGLVYLNVDSIVGKGLKTLTSSEAIDVKTLRERRIEELEQKHHHQQQQQQQQQSNPNNSDLVASTHSNNKSAPKNTGSNNPSTENSQTNESTPAPNSSSNSNALEMDEEEFNEFIAISPEFEDINDNIYLIVEGDELYADVSYPLDEFADDDMLTALKGRYFNGRVKLDIKMQDNGKLDIRVLGAESKGQQIPQSFINKLSNYNIAKKYNRNPAAQKLLQSIKAIDIVNGKVKLAFK